VKPEYFGEYIDYFKARPIDKVMSDQNKEKNNNHQ
jgi:hypothetical protein